MLILLAHLESLWAEETLRDRQAELTVKGVHDLTLLATGEELAAQDAASDRLLSDMKHERPVEW